MTVPLLALYGLGFLVLCGIAPILSRFLCRVWNLEKPNFAGTRIPAATGLTFIIIGGCVYGTLPITGATLGMISAPSFLMVTVGFGILGLLDDKYGSRSVGGFQGHLKSLVAGKPTTGIIKMFGGGILSLLAAFLIYRTDWANLCLAAALIALGANTLNLFDTRPGRAQFSFIALFVLPVTIFTLVTLYQLRYVQPNLLPDDVRFYTPAGVLLGPLVIAAALEWWSDACGKSMMGDTGSNLLGAAGGLAAALTLPLPGRLGLLFVLILLNVAAERISFNTLIEQNRFLRWFDQTLGTRVAKNY